MGFPDPDSVRLRPSWRGAPRRWEPLPPLEDLTGKTSVHEHVCGVGSRPKEGQWHVRQCRCGLWYCYSALRGWRPMGLLGLWRHRRELRLMAGDFFAEADGEPGGFMTGAPSRRRRPWWQVIRRPAWAWHRWRS
jgi:hypothetical protein